MIHSSSISFLKKLASAKYNNKAWFDEHRTDYTAAKTDFIQFADQLIQKHALKDDTIALQQGKQCIFRINRDIRFSKDKTPYKKNMGVSINRGGKKSIYAGYYFHLEPGNSFAGGGIWMPDAESLKKIRQEIDYNFESFKKIVTSKTFKSNFGNLDASEGMKLANVPRGYEKENPAAEYIKYKSWVAMRAIPDEELTTPQLLKNTLKDFEAIQPLITFINTALLEDGE